jgi:serine/threonine protein kinase/tetratricopeptide (TPR) repeat protein
MGEVYLAEDTDLGRKVALKFLSEELEADEAARKRFVREARSAAALDHPYICQVHEAGEEDGKPYIAMEYVEGKTLKDMLVSTPPSPEETIRIAIEVAEALELAHEKGLVHRDLKPANIMLARKGHAKVMDFGLAKRFSTEEEAGEAITTTAITEQGAPVGTVAYMSPEQIKGLKIDARSDIFSFGTVLYEMLAGIHPFKRNASTETLGAILSDDPPPLARYVPKATELLLHSVGKMLAKDPDQRYQSMHEIRTDLQEILQGSTAAVQTGSGVKPPFLRLLRPAWLAAAMLLLAFSVAGLSWWLMETYFKSPAAALAFEERDWILITDFDNTTGETVFDGSLDTAMAVSIQQSRYVNVFPRNRVQQVLARMRRENVKKIDEGLGKEIAVREGIRGLLVCGIGKIGDEYLLTAQLVDPRSSATVYSQAARAAGKHEVLEALEKLANDIRGQLGESLSNIASKNIPLPQATTSSLEALKAFAQSTRTSGMEGRRLLMQAVELDPDFAMAHANLGVQFYTNGESEKGEAHFKKAVGLMDRLTMREKLWIRAVVADWRGEREQGIETYKAYLAQYPDDNMAWFRLGYTCLITSRPAEAVEAFQRVLNLDARESSAFLNIATAYNTMNKDEDAVANYEKAFAMNPKSVTYTNINHEYGFLLVKMGQVAKAVQVFEKMLSQEEPASRGRGHRSLALLDMYLGKYGAAAEHLDQAIALNRAAGYGLSELRDHLYLATVHAAKQNQNAFDKEINEAARLIKKIRPGPVWLLYAGRIDARHGRVRDAGLMLNSMSSSLGDPTATSGVNRNNRTDMAAYNLLKGEIALTGNRYEEAIGLFQTADGLAKDYATESLALAYYRKGDLEKAAAKYAQFLAEDMLGQEAQETWVLANYQLGRIYEQVGETTKAREYYRRFLDLWREGDEDLPVIGDAKNRLR